MDGIIDRRDRHRFYEEYRRLKIRINLTEAQCVRMVRAGRKARDIYAARRDIDQLYERFHYLEHLIVYWAARN